MLNWLRKLGGSSRQTIHPLWQAGQYVTYFLERDVGDWVAFALRLLGQTDDGAWIISADFKTPLGESAIWFRCDPAAPRETPDLIPIKHESVRTSVERSAEPQSLRQEPKTTGDIPVIVCMDPMLMGHLAMNLLMVRRWPEALGSLRKPARDVRYPCEISRAHLLVSPGPGYEKPHDINPRVMLTGVACLSVDGGKNPMTATSFGLNDPNVSGPTSYEDFVDLSHPKRVVHDGFSLTNPATWFLRPEPSETKEGMEAHDYVAVIGGISCSIYFGVTIQAGAPPRIAQERETIVARMGAPQDGPTGRLLPRKGESLQLGDNAVGFATDLENTEIDGSSYSGVFWTDIGDRLAHVIAFGCTSRMNPRRATTLPEMEQNFRKILESSRFA